MPSKPRAVALGAGPLGPACSHTSPGSRKLRGTILVAPGALLGELPFSQPAAMFTEAQEAAGGIGKTAPLDGSSAPRMPTMAGHGHTPSALSEQKNRKSQAQLAKLQDGRRQPTHCARPGQRWVPRPFARDPRACGPRGVEEFPAEMGFGNLQASPPHCLCA